MKHYELRSRFPGGRAKALTFSFDDGVVQDIRFVELLNQYGMKGTFNLNSGCLGQPGRVMTEEQAKKLFADGRHEVAVHTLTHPRLNTLPAGTVVNEIFEDRKNLERIFDRPVRGMAYPYGTSGATETVVAAAKACGIVYSRTTGSTYDFDLPADWLRMPATCKYDDPKLMEIAERFLKEKTDNYPRMFYVWGHTYEFDDYNHWGVIEDFLKLMANREEEIWYATNIEIYEYQQAFERLEFSVDLNFVKNPSAIPVWFWLNGKIRSVQPGELLKLQ